MLDPASFHAAKEAVCAAFGIVPDAMHVHVGMAVWLLIGLATDRSSASFVPLAGLFAIEIASEAIDMLYYGSWARAAPLGDIAATMFWPTVLMIVAGYKRRRAERRAAWVRSVRTGLAFAPDAGRPIAAA